MNEVTNLTEDRKRCFVVMPFSKTTEIHTEDYWHDHFENRLKPLIESNDALEAFRSEPLREDIIRQIINDLVFSPLAVVDLTDSNPNVYWELGVRQSFSHGTITIAEKGSKIPFDIASKSILFYSLEDFGKQSTFTEQFMKAINDCISNPRRPDSAVLETITGRTSVYSVIRREELIRRVDGLILENAVNQRIIQAILDTIFENKGRILQSLRQGWKTVTFRMSYSGLDLLLAEHYLEENADFYDFAHTMLVLIQAANSVLSNWSSGRSPEDWFLENHSNLRDMFQKYGKKLGDIKQNLLSSL